MTTAKVKNVISESIYAVGGQGLSNKVNVWSGFGPTVRSVSGGLLVNSVGVSPHGMGEFAGYNHSAVAPHFDTSGVNETAIINPMGSFTFHCKAFIGEVKYTDIIGHENDATHIAFSVWDGNGYIISKVKALSGMKDIADFDTDAGDRITISNIANTTTYTCKIELLDNAAYDYTGANTICQIPGLENWTTQINIQSANHFYINAPNNTWPPTIVGDLYKFGHWDLHAPSLVPANGKITFQYVKLNELLSGSYNHLHVVCYVEEGFFDGDGVWNGVKVTEDYDHSYDGAWNQNLSQSFSALSAILIWKLGGVTKALPMEYGNYGYRVVISCNPTTV
jgi:hypothetical protein